MPWPSTRPRRGSARRCDRTNARSSFRRNAPAEGGRGTAQSVDLIHPSRSSRLQTILGGAVAFHYLAIEGPIGVGKTRLAERLASKLEATTILEDTENPFLADFYADRPGSALQAQLFYLLNRHRQLTGKRQADLFLQTTICDYVFDKDKIFAYLNLDDNELFIYQRLFDLLARDVPPPDLVVYLQAPTELLMERLRKRDKRSARARSAAAGRGIRPRAQRGLPAFLLPLHGDAAARRRNLGVRSRIRRCGPRRARQANQGHGEGDALLRSAEVVEVAGCSNSCPTGQLVTVN